MGADIAGFSVWRCPYPWGAVRRHGKDRFAGKPAPVPTGKFPEESDAVAAARVSKTLSRLENGHLGNTKGIGSGVVAFRTTSDPATPVATNGGNSEISMRRSPSGTTTGAKNGEHERVRAITGSFDDLVRERMAREPTFGDALRQEALESIQTGDAETGQSILWKYFGAESSAETSTPALAGAK
jgi:hypothetical protein